MNDIQVQKSLNDARWVMVAANDDDIDKIMQKHNLPEFVARLLSSRGINADQVQSFLNPSLKNDFPDPSNMAQMVQMADYVAQAIMGGKTIGVFGDFDVDGATSTATLVRFLRQAGITNVPFYIPDRLGEGYGPNANALAKLKEKGADIVFILDCGTTSHDVIAAGRGMGLDIIIVDHHETEDTLPDANFLINPKRKDDESGYDMLAAVGVTFLCCVALNTALRAKGYYAQHNLAEPNLKQGLDLVGLGTVCDMVPLTGPNRLFVRRGFEYMAQTKNAGLKALMEVGKMTEPPAPYHAGFVMGPRINAGSRVHQSDLGARLLSTDDYEEALNLAWSLDDCNKKRKTLQSDMLARAKTQVMARGLADAPVIIVDDPDGHPGLSGLVAGQISKQYNKPACVIAYADMADGSREGRGSGRSIIGVNLAESFIAARHEGLLIKGGGHAMAGGFTVDPDKINAFYDFMKDHVQGQLNARFEDGNAPLAQLNIDGLITVKGVQTNFVKLVEDQAGPFGQGNPEPVFVLPKVRVERPDIVGKNHVRCFLVDWEGGTRIKAVAFSAVDTALGDALLQNSGHAMHVAGQFKINAWNGRESAEMHILDAAVI